MDVYNTHIYVRTFFIVYKSFMAGITGNPKLTTEVLTAVTRQHAAMSFQELNE